MQHWARSEKKHQKQKKRRNRGKEHLPLIARCPHRNGNTQRDSKLGILGQKKRTASKREEQTIRKGKSGQELVSNAANITQKKRLTGTQLGAVC